MNRALSLLVISVVVVLGALELCTEGLQSFLQAVIVSAKWKSKHCS